MIKYLLVGHNLTDIFVEFCDIIILGNRMLRLKRKIDKYLIEWKNDKFKMPLIVKGARQIGKIEAIENFAKNNYENVIEINFALQKQFISIFDVVLTLMIY